MSYKIEIIKGDITTVEVDAIVNAANNELWMGSGVAGAIKSAGGEIIEQEAIAKGPIMPGEAVHTTAGKLPYKTVIHAAVMGQDLCTSKKLIRQATVASLVIADKLKLSSVAFPAFGTGVGGFPIKACALIMTQAVSGFRPLAEHLECVLFCLFDRHGHQMFKDAMEDE